MEELAEMTNRNIYQFLIKARKQGYSYPTYEAVINYKNTVKQTK